MRAVPGSVVAAVVVPPSWCSSVAPPLAPAAKAAGVTHTSIVCSSITASVNRSASVIARNSLTRWSTSTYLASAAGDLSNEVGSANASRPGLGGVQAVRLQPLYVELARLEIL